MARPPKCRFIRNEPGVSTYKPHGVPRRDLESVKLGLDELEAIRLADLEGLYQDEAAGRMGISRATFGRLVAAAHYKVAEALLNGKILVFRGGNVAMSESRELAEERGSRSRCRRRRRHGRSGEDETNRGHRRRCGHRGLGRGADRDRSATSPPTPEEKS